MARLRLLFALFLMSLGTWFGALAISGYYEPHMMMRTEPVATPAGLLASADTAQFISLLTRERFVAVESPMTPAPAEPKAAKPVGKTKSAVADKRIPQPTPTGGPGP